MGLRKAALFALVVVAGACRAEVTGAADLSGLDLAVEMDLAAPDLSPPIELGPPDLLCSAPVGPENCSNGCDDDHNGYIDDDDPACTAQILATTAGGTTSLNRLLMGTSLLTRTVDGNPVPANMFAIHIAGFSPSVYLLHENAPALLRTLTLSATGTGTNMDYFPTGWGTARDVCIFNNQLIIVQRGQGTSATPSSLRRLDKAGTDLGTLSLGAPIATSCASDGVRLYVGEHDNLFNPSQFRVFDTALVEKTPIQLPSGLGPLNLDRTIDFAWTSRGFYGLFVDGSGSLNDAMLNARQIFPFTMDGGLGAPIDAGVLHGIGTFQP